MKKISLSTTFIVPYVIIVAFAGMALVPLIVGGLKSDEYFKVYTLGYLPLGLILFFLLNLLVSAEVNIDNGDVKLFKSLTRKTINITKEDVLNINKLGLMPCSPTYYIKFRNKHGKIKYFIFIRSLLEDVERVIASYKNNILK